MGLSRPPRRPVRARHRRRPDLLRSSSSALAGTRSGTPAASSPLACCLNAVSLPSAAALPVLPASPVTAGCFEDPALLVVGEFVLDASPRRMPAAPAAALAAAAVLAHRRSDPSIGGRVVPKPAMKTTPASPLRPASLDSCYGCASDGEVVLVPPPVQPTMWAGVPGCDVVSSSFSAPHDVSSSCHGSSSPPSAGRVVGSSLGCLSQPEPPIAAAVGATDGGGAPWQLVQGRRRPRRVDIAPPAFRARPPPPEWLKGRCHRCHVEGHWASMCREPLRCNNCRLFGHKAKGCSAPTAPRPPPVHLRRCEPSPPRQQPVCPSPTPTKEATLAHVSSQSVLAEEARLIRYELQCCLGRVESFLSRAEAALGKLPPMPVVTPLAKLHVGSVSVGEADIYGALSPRGRPYTSPMPDVSSASENEAIVGVVAPVLQIMPELHALCGELASPLSMMDSVVATAVPLPPSPPPLEPSQTLDVVEREGLSDVAVHSTGFIGQVVSVDDNVVESNALAPIPGALFAKKFCDFLINLEADDPGSGKRLGAF